ncbi:MAG: biotin synthase BioB [Desulfovibrionaceae bacterium]|nr:biotin synthase BioB [Desulfovibrionaceae bacterium]
MNILLHTVLRRLTGSLPILEGSSPLVTREEAEVLLEVSSSETLDLLSVAGSVRAVFAPKFFSCGIINAKSGHCPENCAFCAQSAHYRTGSPVYPLLSPDILVEKARMAYQQGNQRFGIVTSGTGPDAAALDQICQAVRRIKKETGIGVCGSLGLIDSESSRLLFEAGMTRYHHNLETAASFFPSICSTHDYEQDLQSVRAAKAAGMETCCGGIFGLGESRAQRVELAFTLANLNVDSIPVNFLNAIPGTPLEHMPKITPEEALRTLAVLRLVNPRRDILIAGGRNHVLGSWQSWIYAAGANGLMTGDYLTTSGTSIDEDKSMMRTLGVRI